MGAELGQMFWLQACSEPKEIWNIGSTAWPPITGNNPTGSGLAEMGAGGPSGPRAACPAMKLKAPQRVQRSSASIPGVPAAPPRLPALPPTSCVSLRQPRPPLCLSFPTHPGKHHQPDCSMRFGCT